MASVRQTESSPQRKAARPVRRQQLIESTISVLARKGYAGLTVADVAKEAGLSAGIVIFHFNSKDELLAAVLGALATEYRNHWEESMNAAGPAAADRLKALLLSDFDTAIYTREKLAAWVAFWGEIQGRPFYDQICAGFDNERQAATEALCTRIIAEGGYALDPHLTMRAQELVERDNVHCLIGPLAAFEALAIDDYIRQTKTPTLSVAAAEDMTQRHPNPWFVRATSTSAQCAHPMADYCAKDLKFKRMITIADDIAYGQEMCAGFQRVFEQSGGKIIQKLFPPLTAPDYGAYVAELKTDADGIFLGLAGSNGFRFLRQFVEYGLKDKIQPVGGMTALDEAVLRNMGDEALGIVTACWYSAELDNALNKRFAASFRKQFSYDPGFYAAATYVEAAVLEAALKNVGGKIEEKDAFMAALRATNVETVRGPVRFDEFGNVVGNVYIRKVTRKDGRLVNSVIKTYPDVSQFWTYDPKQFLAHPVYSRDFPPAKNLEN